MHHLLDCCVVFRGLSWFDRLTTNELSKAHHERTF